MVKFEKWISIFLKEQKARHHYGNPTKQFARKKETKKFYSNFVNKINIDSHNQTKQPYVAK